jgi:5,10-methylenetetrahydromethanopterin reductase
VGASLNLVVHPDREKARALARALTTSFAGFSGMLEREAMQSPSPERRSGVEAGNAQQDVSYQGYQEESHTASLTDAFLERFFIAGPASYCVERLQELSALGLERLIIVGPGRGTDLDEVKQTELRFLQEVLPAL